LPESTVLLLGGSGLVGSTVSQRWSGSLRLEAPTHAQLDLLNDEALVLCLERSRARAVVNVAAWADVDGAEQELGNTHGRVYRLNVTYPRRLAELCGELSKYLIHVSTDYVFDGANLDQPYVEGDTARPLCWYAETKYLGEQSVLRSGANVCVARIEMPFTGRAHRKLDLARTLAGRLIAGQPIRGVTDQRITPVFLDDVADGLRCLVEAPYTGILHVAATTWTTPYELALSIAQRLGLDASLIAPETFERFSRARVAIRPQHSWLDVSLFGRLFSHDVLRSIDDQLDAWVAQFSATQSTVS
jgi:dTDP-4-dehydrorhamnose reductase